MFKQVFATTLLSTMLGLAATAMAQDNRIDTIRPVAPALADYGPHAIGVKTLTLSHAKQLDIVKAKAGEPIPTYDRPLTVEVWYPAKVGATKPGDGEYRGVLIRDGKTEVTLRGRAVRDA